LTGCGAIFAAAVQAHHTVRMPFDRHARLPRGHVTIGLAW
jgi:hypothetical protein